MGATAHDQCTAILLDRHVHYAGRRPRQASQIVVIVSVVTSLMLGVMGVTTYENADYWSLSPTHPNRPVSFVATASSPA